MACGGAEARRARLIRLSPGLRPCLAGRLAPRRRPAGVIALITPCTPCPGGEQRRPVQQFMPLVTPVGFPPASPPVEASPAEAPPPPRPPPARPPPARSPELQSRTAREAVRREGGWRRANRSRDLAAREAQPCRPAPVLRAGTRRAARAAGCARRPLQRLAVQGPPDRRATSARSPCQSKRPANRRPLPISPKPPLSPSSARPRARPRRS